MTAIDAVLVSFLCLFWFSTGIVLGRYLKVIPLLDTLLKREVLNGNIGDRQAGRTKETDKQR